VALKRIKDIRYYETSEVPSGVGLARSVPDGSLYRLPATSATLGQRIAFKLRELGVMLDGFDHLYLALTPALEAAQVVVGGPTMDGWFRYVSCGLPLDFNERSEAERLAILSDRTLAAVRAVCRDGEAQVSAAERLLAELGDDLPIALLHKTTRQFEIALSFTVGPWKVRPSLGWIEVTELASGRRGRAPFVELRFAEEAFTVASRVSVVGRAVVIHPRRSERADLISRSYPTPFRVDVDALLDGRSPAPATPGKRF
jgi:hypothetical protein